MKFIFYLPGVTRRAYSTTFWHIFIAPSLNFKAMSTNSKFADCWSVSPIFADIYIGRSFIDPIDFSVKDQVTYNVCPRGGGALSVSQTSVLNVDYQTLYFVKFDLEQLCCNPLGLQYRVKFFHGKFNKDWLEKGIL